MCALNTPPMPRILHTADWQIGRQYTTFPEEDAVPLAEARVAAVERLAALAVQHAADAVLVAGDVFDLQTVSERTVRQLFNALKGFDGPWVLMPGNHDAALAESVWTRAQRLGVVPAHVHLALRPEPVLLPQARLAVLPAPLTQRHTFDDATAWFDLADTPAGLVRVGLAHGSVQGLLAEHIDSPNPIAPDRAERARLDYLALGDWHGCREVNARTWYSGTPEPDRFRDNDAGHALLVDVPEPGQAPTVTRLPTARHRWFSLEAALHVASDVQALAHSLQQLPDGTVVQVALSGALDLPGHQTLREALAQASARLRHLDAPLGAVRLQPSDEDLARLKADGYLAPVIDDLRHGQAHGTPEQQAVHREALAILAGVLAERQGGAA
jgi:DNA repair exonuclease SbcCD nuclease subunit